MRKKLKEYLNQRCVFSATVAKFGYTTPNRKGNYRTTCLINVRELNSSDIVADHVWVKRDDLAKHKRIKVGDVITFTAIVKTYKKNAEKACSYTLVYPQKVRIIKRNKGVYYDDSSNIR